MSNAEFDSAMSAIPGVTRLEGIEGEMVKGLADAHIKSIKYTPSTTGTPGMEMVYEGRIGAKLPNPTEIRYLHLCKQELSLKIALKAVQETKKETEKELAELDAIGQVEFKW